MTNGWTDISNADVILAMGGNPAENHPVGFRFVMEAKRRRGAKLVAVDPRFQRTAAVADHFVQIRAGTDIAFLGGLINYALQNRRFQEDYVRLHTNAPFIVRDGFTFDEKTGLFSGWDPDKKQYDASTWQYELDGQGNAKVDPTLQHPRSVFQLMKKFYSRYTPQAAHQSLEDYFKVAVPKPLRPNSVNFWSNTPKLFISQLKAYYASSATKENQFGYHLHPKLPENAATGKLENWSWAFIYDHAAQGQVEGLVDFGMNPVCNGPNSRKMVFALSQLKWLVVAENFETETSSFWKPEILALAGKKTEDVKPEEFLLA